MTKKNLRHALIGHLSASPRECGITAWKTLATLTFELLRTDEKVVDSA